MTPWLPNRLPHGRLESSQIDILDMPWFPYRLPHGRFRTAQAYGSALNFAFLPKQNSEQNKLLRRNFLIFFVLSDQQLHAGILPLRNL